VRRGGCGIKKISAQPTLAPQTGWSLTSHSGVSDHPVRSNKEATRHFLNRPPLLTRRGLRSPKNLLRKNKK
jgi:hypothetical protein